MLNRRHIRVKILQILYSQNRSKSTIKELYDFFNSTTKKFYQFFITQLHFFVLIKQETRRRVEINKKKYYESKIDFLVDFIVENKFIKAIRKYLPLKSNDIKKDLELECDHKATDCHKEDSDGSTIWTDCKPLQRIKCVLQIYQEAISNSSMWDKISISSLISIDCNNLLVTVNGWFTKHYMKTIEN